MAWLRTVADVIDRLNDRLGRAVSWLTLVLVVTTASVAILRYVLSSGWVWMQDAYLWAFGTMIFMGAAYALLHDKHVRVDFFYNSRGDRYRAAIDLFGAILFLFPTIGVLVWINYPYVSNSWGRFEGSLEAGGLPGVFLLKSILILFCVPLAVQGISFVIRNVLVLFDDPVGRRSDSEMP
jgi:TRAP-type mannitol/chloroaromatic compound transport system permease small subunit